MVSFKNASIVAISVLAMSQEAFALSTALKVGAQLVGGVLGSSGSQQRRDTPATGGLNNADFASLPPVFKNCITELHDNPKHEIKLNKQTKDAQMSGLPAVCMQAGESYINSTEAKTSSEKLTKINDNTFQFSGVSDIVNQLLQADGAGNGTAGAAPKKSGDEKSGGKKSGEPKKDSKPAAAAAKPAQ